MTYYKPFLKPVEVVAVLTSRFKSYETPLWSTLSHSYTLLPSLIPSSKRAAATSIYVGAFVINIVRFPSSLFIWSYTLLIKPHSISNSQFSSGFVRWWNGTGGTCRNSQPVSSKGIGCRTNYGRRVDLGEKSYVTLCDFLIARFAHTKSLRGIFRLRFYFTMQPLSN